MHHPLKFTRSLVVGFGFFWILGCSPSPGTVSSPRIAFGAISEGQYPSVVKIHAKHRPDQICSASFIAPRLLLTAAHCFRAGSDGVPLMMYGDAPLARVYLHPRFADPTIDWQEDDVDLYTQPHRAFDFALGVFDADVAPAFVEVAHQPVTAGTSVLMVGYGDWIVQSDGDGHWEIKGGHGAQRFGTSTVTKATGSLIHTQSIATAPDHAANNAAVGEGDSGGPMFVRVDDPLRPLRQVGLASGRASNHSLLLSRHTSLQGRASSEFYEWLSHEPRCLRVAGSVPASDCQPAQDDGRLEYH